MDKLQVAIAFLKLKMQATFQREEFWLKRSKITTSVQVYPFSNEAFEIQTNEMSYKNHRGIINYKINTRTNFPHLQSRSHVWIWELDIKESWAMKN